MFSSPTRVFDQRFSIWLCLVLLAGSPVYSQTFILKGVVRDAQTGKPLSEANVLLVHAGRLASTDSTGTFLFRDVQIGEEQIRISFVGYRTVRRSLDLQGNLQLALLLEPVVLQFAEMVITATRSALPTFDTPVAVEVFRVRDKMAGFGVTAADLLMGATSLQVRDYGGANGLKTVTLRGTGPEHTIVLLNGHRINNYQNGLLDFSLIPLDEIERIEIARGGHSALYGADALGGVINILTRRAAGKPRMKAGIEVGSFGLRGFQALIQTKSGPFGVLAGFDRREGENNYEFVSHLGVTPVKRERLHAGHQLQHAYLDATYRPREDFILSLFTRYVSADRDVPGPFVSDRPSKATQQDEDWKVLLSLDSPLDSRGKARVGLNFQYSYLHYVDSALVLGGSILDSYYRNISVSGTGQVDYEWYSGLRTSLGAEATNARAVSNELAVGFDRTQVGVFFAPQIRLSTPWNHHLNVMLFPTLRFDSFSDVGSSWSPKIGVSIGVIEKPMLILRASAGKNFRAPTFNDLYWKQGGNPTLQPEQSESVDVGVRTLVNFWGAHATEVTYFSIETENRIIWMPANGTNVWSPVNVGRVLSRGFELSHVWRARSDLFEVRTNYTYTDARKKNRSDSSDRTFNKSLIYVPRHMLNLGLSVRYGIASLNLRHRVVSKRYFTEMNDRALPSYRILDASVHLRIPLRVFVVHARVEVLNALDEDYQVIVQYPTPLRNYRIAVTIEF